MAEDTARDEQNDDVELDEREAEDQAQEQEEDEQLREQGAKALREERKRARTFRSELVKLGYTVNKDGSFEPPKSRSAKDNHTEIDEDAIRASVRQEIEGEHNARLLVSESVTELIAAGVKGNPRRVARMLDLDGISVNEGQVDLAALRDAIDDLKEDSPELFRRSRTREEPEDEEEERPTRRRATGSADQGKGSRSSGGGKSLNPLEKALMNAVGNSGRQP